MRASRELRCARSKSLAWPFGTPTENVSGEYRRNSERRCAWPRCIKGVICLVTASHRNSRPEDSRRFHRIKPFPLVRASERGHIPTTGHWHGGSDRAKPSAQLRYRDRGCFHFNSGSSRLAARLPQGPRTWNPLVCLLPHTSPVHSLALPRRKTGGKLNTQRIISELKAEEIASIRLLQHWTAQAQLEMSPSAQFPWTGHGRQENAIILLLQDASGYPC